MDIVLPEEDPYTVDLGDGLEVTAAGAAAAAGQTGFASLHAISQAMVQAAQARRLVVLQLMTTRSQRAPGFLHRNMEQCHQWHRW